MIAVQRDRTDDAGAPIKPSAAWFTTADVPVSSGDGLTFAVGALPALQPKARRPGSVG